MDRGEEAAKMIENIKGITEENTNVEEKQLFRWIQTNFHNLKTGNKGKIERISKEPLRVIFNNETIKRQMTSSGNEIEWQNKYYIVDVEVLFDNDKPKVYKILENYPDDSFSIFDQK